MRFFRAFSSIVRQMVRYNLERRGTARTLPLILLFCVLFVCKCVLSHFVCKCVLSHCHRVLTNCSWQICQRIKCHLSSLSSIPSLICTPDQAANCLTLGHQTGSWSHTSSETWGYVAVTMKNTLHWDVTPFSAVGIYRRFRQTCCLTPSLRMEAASSPPKADKSLPDFSVRHR